MYIYHTYTYVYKYIYVCIYVHFYLYYWLLILSPQGKQKLFVCYRSFQFLLPILQTNGGGTKNVFYT